MAKTEFNRDWNVDVTDVPLTILGARPVRAGAERTLYLPTWRMFRLFRTHRPRVVVLDGWESPAFWQARILARIVGARVVLSYWSTVKTHRFSSGPVATFRGWFFRTADRVITPGKDSTDAVAAMGVDPDKITTCFVTVDVDRFKPVPARIPMQRKVGHRYLFVGQLIPRKNLTQLLDAFAEVRANDDSLTIVGSGPLSLELQQHAERLNIATSVLFLGHLDGDELVNAYASANTLVLPSTHEVWGVVANEAMAAGLSVIVSDRCGVANSIRGQNGVHTAHSMADLRTSLRAVRADPTHIPAPRQLDPQSPQALARMLSEELSRRDGHVSS